MRGAPLGQWSIGPDAAKESTRCGLEHAPASSVITEYHGVRVSDPYRWLEDASSKAVQDWSAAQNLQTRNYLDNLPLREAIRSQIEARSAGFPPRYQKLQATRNGYFAFYKDPARQQPAVVRLDSLDAPVHKIVIDPLTLSPSGDVVVDWFSASPDGKMVAASLSKTGTEVGALHLFDARTGKEIEPVIPLVYYPTSLGSFAWRGDSKGFWYTRYPKGTDGLGESGYFHVLGKPWRTDSLLLSKRDGIPANAEIFFHNPAHNDVVVANVQLGDTGKWQQFVVRSAGRATRVAGYSDGIVEAIMGQDRSVYGVSFAGAPRGKILKITPPYAGGFPRGRVVVGEQQDLAVQPQFEGQMPAISTTKDRLIVKYSAGGANRVRTFTLAGKPAGDFPIAPVANVFEIEPLDDGDVLFWSGSFTTLNEYLLWDHRHGTASRTGLRPISKTDYSNVVVERHFAASKDGTQVPFSVLYRRDVRPSASTPTLMTGYGGFGLSQVPQMLGEMPGAWIESGGLYVETNLRGGAEYGDDWHEQAKFTRKQNTFDDLYAIARWLIANGYTSPRHLGLFGGSNGGLLVGAAITQHPEMFRAAVAEVGIFDMLRNELDPNGAYNAGEYGSVKDPKQFAALLAYSPYHNVRSCVPYPAVLLVAGDRDQRVNPMNSRKFAAALQAATSSGLPILLRTSAKAGHGFNSTSSEKVEEQTDEMLFLWSQLASPQATTLLRSE